MKSKLSLAGAIVFIFGKNSIASLFPEQVEVFIGLGCLIIGAVLLGYVYTYEESKKKCIVEMMQHLACDISDMRERMEKLLTCEGFEDIVKEDRELIHTMNNKIDNNFLNSMNQLEKNIRILIEEMSDIIKSSFEFQKEQEEKANKQISKNIAHIQSTVQTGLGRQEEMLTVLQDVKKIPDRLYMLHDELNKDMEKNAEQIANRFDELCENMEHDYGKLAKDLKNSYNNLIEAVEEQGEKQSEAIEQLAQEYKVFKEYTDEMVKKMTLLSNEDYAFLRGLFNE